MTFEELKEVAKPVIVGITLDGQSDFLAVTDIRTDTLTGEEKVDYNYKGDEGSLELDDFLDLWDPDEDGLGKVYLPAGEVEVPSWAQEIIDAENFRLFTLLKRSQNLHLWIL